MKKSLITILIIVILGGLGYFAYTKGLINLDFLKKDSDLVVVNEKESIDTKIYSSHGFSIEIPEGYTPFEQESEGGPSIVIYVSEDSSIYYTNRYSWWEEYEIPNLKYIKDEKIGENTFKVYSDENGAINYLLKNGDEGYQFNGTKNQLETFKITEWKTYSNDKYGFSFEYPASYKIEKPEEGLISRDDQKYILKLFNGEETILISYANQKILDLSTGKYGPDKIYFNTETNQWMRNHSYISEEGEIQTKIESIKPNYTKGSLPYFINHRGTGTENATVLSKDTFVIIQVGNTGPITDVVDRITSTFTIIE